MFKGRIVAFDSCSTQTMCSVKGRHSYSNFGSGYYNGAGGICSYPESHLYMKFVVYTPHGNVTRDVDVRPYIKKKTDGKRFTKKFLDTIRKNNVGRKVFFIPDPVYCGQYDLYDYNCLDLSEN